MEEDDDDDDEEGDDDDNHDAGACRDAYCSDMSMLRVCIPLWLKAIQTLPE